MNINLKKHHLEVMGVKHLEPYGYTEDKSKYNKKKWDVDLSRCTTTKSRDFLKLLQLFEKKGVPGLTTLIADTETWLAATDAAGEQKTRKVANFAPLLKAYLKDAPKHWVYTKNEDTEQWSPRYVTSIKFIERHVDLRGVTPAHVDVKFAFTELGESETEEETFWERNCVGVTVKQALAFMGYVIETPERLADYEAQMKKYSDNYDKVGKQFLGVGFATDDVDGNDHDSSSWWRRTQTIILNKNDTPSRLVIDVTKEGDKKNSSKDTVIDTSFWNKEPSDFNGSKDDDDNDIHPEDVDEEAVAEIAQIPVNPMVVCFDMKRHMRLRVHITQLTEYVYDQSLGEKLILPDEVRGLVTMLVGHDGGFKDIIGNKSGGAIILCAGIPGSGKTLTSEVYSEAMTRPLYSVQCSQLGTSPDELEDELLKVFARAQRWKAILLLDEADVYVAARGNDLVQNAIVGVFLRVLEYYNGVLFLTTNRADLVDDAVASRCIARINYTIPTTPNQQKIWRVLADSAGIALPDSVIKTITTKYNNLTGRDIKNLLKLAQMVTKVKKEPITVKTIDFVKQFKPTEESK